MAEASVSKLPHDSLRGVITLTPRRLLAIASVCTAAGFVIGFSVHQPTRASVNPDVLARMQAINVEAQRVLSEQEALYNCRLTQSVVPAQPTPPARAGQKVLP